MGKFIGKIFSVAISKISPKITDFIKLLLTKLLDFLERNFNNLIKHIGAIGGAGLGLGLVTNLTDTLVNGGVEKFSYFSRVLGLSSLFSNLSNTLTPYMTAWDCTFLEAFGAFGGITAVNTIINSCAYALIFWLSVVCLKWVLGLLPALVALVARI